MTLDVDGLLTVAGHAQRNIWRLESLDPHSQVTILADSYMGKKLNSPNDLVYRSDAHFTSLTRLMDCLPRKTTTRLSSFR